MFSVIPGGVILIKPTFSSFFLKTDTCITLPFHYIEWCIYSGPDINLDGDEDDDDSQRPGPSGAANGHQKARTPQQKAGEGMLKRILEEVEGECYSFR